MSGRGGSADDAGAGLPLLLDLAGRRVVAVGAGPVTARRLPAWLEAGADVHVVAPWACEDVLELAWAGRVTWHERDAVAADLDEAWLAHTATGDRWADAEVARWAEERRVFCVAAGDAAAGTARTPATARVDDVVVAVNAGDDPRRAVRLRNAVATALQTGELPVRRSRSGAGHVALVGGGPGDPGLLTTRGRRLLAEADVVVVDRLAPRELLSELDDDVEVVEAGKAPGRHALRQEEINAAIVEHGRAGRRVVRLKGGDPYVLGRGSEEERACLEAGLEVEVVPGVTSALAVPAAAGIPVTERGVTSRFAVVSGHDAPLDFGALAALEGTLLFLMGVRRLEEIARRLVEEGRPSDQPVAVVERGTTPQQRVTVGTLATIAQLAIEREVENPAVVVVGDVAARAVTS